MWNAMFGSSHRVQSNLSNREKINLYECKRAQWCFIVMTTVQILMTMKSWLNFEHWSQSIFTIAFFFFFKVQYKLTGSALINLSVIINAFIAISACHYGSLWSDRPNWKMVTSVLNSYFRTMIFSKFIFQFNFSGFSQKQCSGSDWSVKTLFETSPSVLTCTLLT